jgi:protein-arginine kinase
LTEAIDSTLVHRLLLQVQPAHLALARPNDPMETLEQQAAARAALLRDALAPLRASIG